MKKLIPRSVILVVALCAMHAQQLMAGPDIRGYGNQGYAFNVQESNANWGDYVTLTWAVLNYGTASSGSFKVGLYLSADSNIDPATDYRFITVQFPSLTPDNGAGYLNALFLLPSVNPLPGSPSTIYIGMVVDVDNEVVEDDETNNRNLGTGIDRDDTPLTITPPVPDIFATDSVVPGNDNAIPFGSVSNDGVGNSRGVQTLTVINKGKATLNVTGITLSGSSAFSIVAIASSIQSFVSTSSLPRAIAKNGTENWVFTVQFDPTTSTALTGTLTITTNDPDTPSLAIALSGTGTPVPDIALTTPEAVETDFGDVVQDGAGGGSTTRTVTLKNIGTGPLTVNQNGITFLTGTHYQVVSVTSSTQGVLNLATAPRTMAAAGAETWDVVVRFDPTAFGQLNDGLRVASDDPDEATFTVSLRGRGLQPMQLVVTDSIGAAGDHAMAYPDTHADGANLVTSSATVTLKNSGEAPLTISQDGLTFVTGTHFRVASVSSDQTGAVDLSAATKTIAGGNGETLTVTVVFDPLGTGALADTLRIASDDLAAPLVTVALTGTGLSEPDIRVTDSAAPGDDLAVPFGTVLNDGAGGRTATHTLVLSNPGAQPLVIGQNGLTFSGGAGFGVNGIVSSIDGAVDVTSANAAARTLSPAQAETWTVTLAFDPAANGAATSTLSIASNDPQTPVTQVALSGTGATPSITMQKPDIALNVSAGTVFKITWQDSYAGGDGAIALHLDTDTNPASGLIPIATGISEDSAENSFDWRVDPALVGGTYRVYVTVADGSVTVGDYADGSLIVDGQGKFQLRSSQQVTSADYAYDFVYDGQTYTGTRNLVPGVNTVTVTINPAGGGTVTVQFQVTVVSSLTAVQAAEHDTLNRVEQTTNGNGISTTLTYDKLGRLVSRQSSNGALVTFEYDVVNRRISMTDSTGTTFYEYDDLSRPTAIITSQNDTKGDSDDLPLRYEWDLAGRRTAIVLPGGERTQYDYDNAGRMTTVNNVTRSLVFNYTYNTTTGQLTKLTRPNGIETLYSYDGMARLTTILHQRTAGSSLVAEYFYTLDAAGKALEMRTTLPGGVIKREGYSYDRFDRLTQAIYADDGTIDANDRTQLWTYDGNGNRLTQTTKVNNIATEVLTYHYGNENRLLSVTDQTGATTAEYKYDAAGNRIQEITPQKTTNYAYDERNLLVSVSDGGAVVNYAYDGDGHRIAKTVNGVTATFINDLTRPVYESVQERNTGGAAASSIFGLSRLDTVVGITPTFEMTDRLGSVRHTADATGALSGTFGYEAFGKLNSAGVATHGYMFTGEALEAESGLVFLRARVLHPSNGSFISKDPLGVTAGTNGFSYCHGDAINCSDPSGMVASDLADKYDQWSAQNQKLYTSMINADDQRISGAGQMGIVAQSLMDALLPVDALRLGANDQKILDAYRNEGIAAGTYELFMDIKRATDVIGIASWKIPFESKGFNPLLSLDLSPSAFAYSSKVEINNLLGQVGDWTSGIMAAAQSVDPMLGLPQNWQYSGIGGVSADVLSAKVSNQNSLSSGLVGWTSDFVSSLWKNVVPPPPPPGGVLLDKAATLVGSNLSDLRGAMYDPVTGQFVFLGTEGGAAVKDINLDYLYTALQAVYGSAVPPFVTLDPPASAYTQWTDLGDGDGVFEPGEKGGFMILYNPVWPQQDTTVDVTLRTGSGDWTARFDCVAMTSIILDNGAPVMKMAFNSWVTAPPAGVTLDTTRWTSSPTSLDTILASFTPDTQALYNHFTLTNNSASTFVVSRVSVYPARHHRKYGGRVEGSKMGWVMLEADRVMKCLAVGKDNLTEDLYNHNTVGVLDFFNLGERYLAAGSINPESGPTRMWLTPNEMTLKRHIDPETGRASIVFDQASVKVNTEAVILGLPQSPEPHAFADHLTANYDTFANLSFPCVDPDDPTGTNIINVKIFDMLRDVMRAVSLARFFRDNGVPVDMWWLNSWQPPAAYSVKSTPAVTNTINGGNGTIVMYGGCQIAKPNAYVPSATAKSVADVVQSSHPDVTGKPGSDLKEQVWNANTVEGNLKAVAASADAEPQNGTINLAEVDLSFPSPGALPLEFVRYYQSSYLGKLCMGPGWRFTPFVLEFERPSWYDDNGLMKNNGTAVYKDIKKNTRLRSGTVRVVDLRSGGALDFSSSLELGYAVSNTGTVSISLTGLDANGLPTFTPGQRQSGATFVQFTETVSSVKYHKYRLTSPDGAELIFDDEGRLLRTKDRNNKTQTYAWNADGCLLTLTDNAAQSLTLNYDASKRLTSVVGPHSEQVNYTYTPQGCLLRATHVRSSAYVEYHYNANCQLDKKTLFNGQDVLQTLPDLKGRPETATDVRGNNVNQTFTQDAAGEARTTTTIDPLITDAAFVPPQAQFDREGRLLTSRSETNEQTSFGYDAGSLAPNTINLPIADRPAITIERNTLGQPTIISDPGNTGAQDVTATYDPTTRLPTQVTDPAGRATNMTYDANKNVQQVRRHLGAQNVDMDFGYTANGALNTIQNPLGITAVTINRDTLDRVASVVDATGVTIGYQYDTLGRLWKITDPRLSTAVEYVYDNFDRVIEIRFPAGSVFYGYDPVKGWLTSMTDILGRTTNYIRDPNTGDITQVVDDVVGGPDRVTSMTYNRFGQLESVTPPDAAPIVFTYDQIGRLVSNTETDVTAPGPVKALDSNNADDGVTTTAVNHVFAWGAPDTDNGIAGYSYAFDQTPDNTIDSSSAGAVWNNVPVGTHTFQVKAKGNNGLWGVVAVFDLIVISPNVTLSLSGSPMSEDGGNGTVTATLSLASVSNVTVSLAFSGTASLGSDYTRSGTSITIPAGSTSGSITLTGIHDLTHETDETVIVDIASVTNGTESGSQQVTAIITDDDSAVGKIAFASNRDGNEEIYLMNADGTGLFRLTNNPAQDSEPAFSVDGSKIAITTNRDGNNEIYLVNSTTAVTTRLTSNAADDSSPSIGSGKVAFRSTRDGNGEIYVMNTDGSAQTRLTTDAANETSPAISPDGSKVAFVSDRDGNAEIYVTNTGGSGLVRLTTNAASDTAPAFNSDGTKVAFVSDRDGNPEVYVMNADGTGAVRLTNHAASDDAPAFGVTGSLAFVSARDGNPEIHRMDGTGGALARLTNHAATDSHPSWAIPGVGVTISESGNLTEVTEGGATDSYTLVLDSQPSANVVITIDAGSQLSVSGPTLSGNAVTFTNANWSTPQAVTVTATDDAVAEGTHVGTITHASSSADIGYNALGIGSVTADVTDNDTAGVLVTQSDGNTAVTEGGATDSYTVALTSQPGANVNITIDPAAQLSVSGPSVSANAITFTPANWSAAQTITVAAVNDAVAEGSHAGTIAHQASSADPNYNTSVQGFTAAITDNDTAGVSIVQSGGTTAVTEGGTTDSYSIVLTSQPVANVTVAINPGSQVSVSGPTLASNTVVFTSGTWNAAQIITVTAVDDVLPEGTHASAVTHAATSPDPTYNGVAVEGVNVSITDNDAAPEIVVERPAGTDLADGSATADFGTALVGGFRDLAFTVRNTGTADLSGLAVTFDGANAGDFTVSAAPTSPVVPGGSTTFTVRFSPGAAGGRSASLHLASNDADENPFDVNLSGIGNPLFRPSSLSANLVGWWKLDEQSGSRLDSSVNGNHLGSVNGVGSANDDYWGTGEPSADIEQDLSQRLTISNASQTGLGMTGPFTFYCQFKREAANGGVLLRKFDGSAGYYVLVESTGVLRALFNSGSGSPDLIASQTLATGKWYDMAFVFDGSYMLLYLDGNLIASRSETRSPSANAADFILGDTFDGLMKDAAIWNRALSSLEVKSLAFGVDLASAYRPGNTSAPPTAWWKLNELAGTRKNSITGPHPISPAGTAQLDTAQSKFGSAALQLNGSTDYLRTPMADGLNFGSSDFTIEFWMRFASSTGGNQYPVMVNREANNWNYIVCGRAGETWYFALKDNNVIQVNIQEPDALSSNVWYHVAFVRQGSAWKVYRDGQLKGVGVTYAPACPNFVSDVDIGAANNSAFVNGWMDELRISKGIARYTGNFTPPSTPFAADDQTSLLLHFDGTDGATAMPDSTANFQLNLTDVSTVGSAGGFVEGAGASFSGDYLVIEDNQESNLTFDSQEAALTVSAWVKPASLGLSTIGVLAKVVSNADSNGYGLMLHSNGSADFFVGRGGSFGAAQSPVNAVRAGAWSHLVGVHDPAANQVRLYVDGKLAATTSHAAGVGNTLGSRFTIGVNSGAVSGADYYSGGASDVAVWNHVLTDVEIKALATGLPLQQTGVISYWGLDETSGTRHDSVGANYLSPINGVGNAMGVVGHAADFEKDSNQFLSIADATQTGLDITRDLTVIAWVKPESTSALTFLDKNGNGEGYALNTTAGSAYFLETYGSTIVATTLAGMGAWQHVVGVRDGASKSIWVDSRMENSSAQTAEMKDTTTDFFLGRHYSVGTRYWDGLLDEVVVAKRWFRDEEIKALYNRGLNGLAAFPQPEIVIEHPSGSGLADGTSSISFGPVAVSSASAVKTFTIRNMGGADLTGLAVTKDGANAGDFAVSTSLMSASLAPNASTTFTVTMTPSGVGSRAAAIHVASNDGDENTFDISLTGTGNDVTGPAGGTMMLTPATPFDPSTALTVAFTDWTDVSAPLTYSVYIDDIIIGAQGTSASRNFTGPVTPGSHTLKGRIYDSLNNVTEVTQSFAVNTPQESWRQLHFGTSSNTGNAADTFDFDQDGLVNLIEFAFGLNPTLGTSIQLPQGQVIGGDFVISFPTPAGISGITYGAEWSPALSTNPADWTTIPDTGTGGTHVFSVPVGINQRMFVRMKVTSP